MNILFVEDDTIIASGLVYALQAEGWNVTHCADLANALQVLEERTFALALLDLSLPDGSGFELLQQIRSAGPALHSSNMPVIFITAADDEGNTVRALEMGADDYITKPFRLRELLARVKGVLRRSRETPGSVLELGNIKIDPVKAKVHKNGVEILLTALEYRLLLTFAHNKGQVLTRGQILENLWDIAGNYVNDNTLTVYIKRLREKLEDDMQMPKLIQTVRGLGYKAGE